MDWINMDFGAPMI